MTMTTRSMAIRRRREEGETLRSWSDLPEGLLHTILMRLCSLVDFISFKSVCRSWRAVASSLSPSVIISHFPPLLLFPTLYRGRFSGFGVLDPTSPSFYSMLSFNSKKFKHLGIVCYSHGHLLGMLHKRVVIINLFNGDEFSSPILPKYRNLFTPTHGMYVEPTRYVLASPPTSPDSGLLVFTNGPLLYWSIGSNSWSCYLPRPKIWGDLGVITVQGKVYVMSPSDYRLFILDFTPKLHLRPLAVDGIKRDSFCLQHFLVDCGGELLYVQLVPTFIGGYARFELFRLDLSVNGPRWVKKETLENWAIFVGYGFWLPSLAVQNPERWGGRSNCIYFHRNHKNHDSPFAVLNLGDEIDMSYPQSPMHCAAGRVDRLSSEWFRPGF